MFSGQRHLTRHISRNVEMFQQWNKLKPKSSYKVKNAKAQKFNNRYNGIRQSL